MRKFLTLTFVALMVTVSGSMAVDFINENMDTDPGWTTTASWAYGIPQGACGDPVSGITGANVYGYNLDGCYEANMGEETLTTTVFDCSAAANVYLDFYRWLGVETSLYDFAYIRVSTDGTTFNNVWTNPDTADVVDDYWMFLHFDLSILLAGQSTCYIQWVQGTADGGLEYGGWNIDDVLVSDGLVNTPTPSPTPPLFVDYEVDVVRIENGGINADNTLMTTAATFDIFVTVENLGGLDPGFNITVTDPGLPGWSSSATVFAGLTADCNEIALGTSWPDTYTPATCNGHQLDVVLTATGDIDPTNDTMTKLIDIPDLSGTTFEMARDNGTIGTIASWGGNSDYIAFVKLTAPSDCDVNYLIYGMVNKDNNFAGYPWPDDTVEAFKVHFCREDPGTGLPVLPAEYSDGNMWVGHDPAGPDTRVDVFWSPNCTISLVAGENFFIGYSPGDNCSNLGSEGFCLDSDGVSADNFYLYDGAGSWYLDPFAWDADPMFSVNATYTGPTPTPTATPIPSGPGDWCNEPISLTCGTCVSGTTIGTGNHYNSECGPYMSNFNGNDVVYEFVLDDAYDVTFLGEAEYDADWAIVAGTCDSGATEPFYCIDNTAKTTSPSCSTIPPTPGPETWGDLELTQTMGPGTYYIWVDGYDTSEGAFFLETLCNPIAAAMDCPVGSFWSTAGNSGSAFYSDDASAWSVADNFIGAYSINEVTWWGIEYGSTGGCIRDNPDFTLSFYEDNGGLPGTVAWTGTVTPVRVDTGEEFFAGVPIYSYTVTLGTPVDLTDGWVGMVGQASTDCLFVALGSWSDDFQHANTNDGITWSLSGDNVGLCLSGSPLATPTPAPIPTTGPMGIGIIIFALSGLLSLSALRRRK